MDAVLRHREFLGPALRDKAGAAAEVMWALVRDELEQRLRRSEAVRGVLDEVRAEVLSGDMPATSAADAILAAYDRP